VRGKRKDYIQLPRQIWIKKVKKMSESTRDRITEISDELRDMLIEKNFAYGDSALDPTRIFSKADNIEQLYVRIDDKLSRVQRGHEYPGDDTIKDLIGYLVLLLIAKERNNV
jgi:hypothetical protein